MEIPSRDGRGSGGNDTFNISGSPAAVSPYVSNEIYGDTSTSGSGASGYTAGADVLNFTAVEGAGGAIETFFYGDARKVQNGILHGAIDTVNASASDLPLTVFGEAEQLTGNAAIYTIILNGAADIINGSQGADHVYGEVRHFRAGTLVGAGDDIDTNGGNDLIYGDAEILTFQLLAGASFVGGDDDINAGADNDKVWGDFKEIEIGAAITSITFGNDTIIGGTGDDQLWGDYEEHNGLLGINAGGMDTIDGGTGNDEIDGGGGDDDLDGGADNDTASYDSATSGVTVSLALQGAAQNTGGAGNDTLNNFENLRGGDFNDTLTGDGNDNTIEGGDGDDTLNGGGHGSSGDTLSYEHASAAVTVSLGLQGSAQNTVGAGIDTATNFENLRGSAHADGLVGNGSDNVIEGGDGNDTINGAGNGAYGDTASYEHASSGVTVTLSTPGIQQDTIGAGLDTLTNIENLLGSAHADTLLGSLGNNYLDGGDGEDTVSYDNAGSAVTVLLSQQGSGQNTGAMGTDTLVNFENVTGSDYDDLLGGDDGDNVIDGGAGNNTVTYAHASGGITLTLKDQGVAQNTGSAGVDTLINIQNLIGSDFNDTIFAHNLPTVFTIDGGNGIDTLDFSQDTSSILVDLSLTSYQGGIAASISNFENLIGTSFDDSIGASAANNVLDGGDGVDRLDFMSSGSGVTVSLALQGTVQNTGGSGMDTYTNFENLWGSNHNDVLTGDSGANEVYGLDGADVIEGGNGNDKLYGGAGIDLVSYANATAGVTVDLGIQGTNPGFHTQNTGVTGIDWLNEFEGVIGSAFDDILTTGGNLDPAMEMYGGAGDDFIRIAGDQAHSVDGGDGSDTLDFSHSGGILSVTVDMTAGTAIFSGFGGATMTFVDIENIICGVGIQTITGNAEDNIIEGGTFSPGAPTISDNLDGGDGNDTASYWNHANAVNVSLLLQGTSQDTGDGFDVLQNFENLLGSAYNDTLTGDTGNNIIEGGDGNDMLDGHTGSDTASYSRATSGVTVSLAAQGAAQNTVGAGSDTLSNFENLLGSKFDDTLTGDSGDNKIEGGDGNDTLDGLGGNDTASYSRATSGVTVSLAAQGSAQNTVGAGSDTLSNFENLLGSDFADILTGDTGNNILNGGAGTDSLFGGDGNDTLIGGVGGDTLDGGAGVDTADYSGETWGIGINLANGAAWSQALGDTLIDIENITGTAYNDAITGDSGNNILSAAGGNDVLVGGAGNDFLYGGWGNDQLTGGTGGDVLNGGAGVDYANYGGETWGIGINLTNGTTWSQAAGDTLIGIENINATAYADALTGDGVKNILSGFGGNDTLNGMGGNDWLYGGWGVDTLIGGDGDDTLNGGGSNDVFVFADGFGNDTITDFNALNDLEDIDLSGVSAITDWTDLSTPANGHLYEDGLGNTIIDDGAGNTITLTGVALADLHEADFVF